MSKIIQMIKETPLFGSYTLENKLDEMPIKHQYQALKDACLEIEVTVDKEERRLLLAFIFDICLRLRREEDKRDDSKKKK